MFSTKKYVVLKANSHEFSDTEHKQFVLARFLVNDVH